MTTVAAAPIAGSWRANRFMPEVSAVVQPSAARWTRASLLVLAMTALGHALQISDGELGHRPYPSIVWLTIAILPAAAALFLTRPLRIGPRGFQRLAALCLGFNFVQLAVKRPDHYVGAHAWIPLTPFTIGVLIMAALCARTLASEGMRRVFSFAGALIILIVLGHWTIISSPDPTIDVYVFQRDSSAALLRGENPYDMTFPQIYSPQKKVYGEGVVQANRLEFGYPYLPETLFAIIPTALLHADPRYAQLAALILSAVLIVATNRAFAGYAAALLFLTTPRLFYVLEKSWIEPFTILTLAATTWCAVRWPRLLSVALGLFLASKQYVPAAAVLCFVGQRPWRETLWLLFQAVAVALIVTLPMALWDLHAFVHSVLTLQFRQPFRSDSLSYLAWMGEAFWPKGAMVLIPFATFFASAALVLWRRKSIGFATAVAFCFLMFFAFNKQAFANYYFFVIGAMACGIVELNSEREMAPWRAWR